MEKDEPERVCWISGGRRPTPTGFRRVEFSSATVTVSVFRIFFCHNFLAVSLGSVLNFDTPVQFNIGSVWFSFWFFPTPNPEPVYLILSVYTSKFEVQPWLSCSLQLHFPPSSTTLHILTHFAISQVILLNSFIKLLPLLLLL